MTCTLEIAIQILQSMTMLKYDFEALGLYSGDISYFVFKFKLMPELIDLTLTYKPDIIWSDGDWEAYSDYWMSRDFLAWLYNQSPVKDHVVVNDRWGIETLCKHGGFITCADRYSPGHLVDRKWENAMTLDLGSWGYRHNMKFEDIIKIKDLIKEVVITVSCGGNILINVGPNADGVIPVIFEERLRELGKWLKINGEAIYSTKPWIIQTDPLSTNITWYTSKLDDFEILTNIYAIILQPPNSLVNEQGLLKLQTKYECKLIVDISILGVFDKNNHLESSKSLPWNCSNTDSSLLYVSFKNFSFNTLASEWAWVLNIVTF